MKNKRNWVFIITCIVAVAAFASLVVIFAVKAFQENDYPEEGITCPAGQHLACVWYEDGSHECECEDWRYEIKKPMVYLYPEVETEVSVKLGYPEKLVTSYPRYKDGWNVVAAPDGTLTLGTKKFYGLYWEGKDYPFAVTDEGFIVRGENAADFLEEKLRILGLNEREANEFIVYWLPVLEKNEYNYVRFAEKKEIDDYMPLLVTPEVDTLIRVYMVTKPVDKDFEVKEQKLTLAGKRTGFTVVEWGGSN